MKKIVALLLALTMVFALCACGDTKENDTPKDGDETKEVIAFCSDVGSIDDESFNQFTYAGVKAIAEENGMEEPQYYIPAEDNTEQRETNVRQAVTDGATIIVVTGFMYGETLTWAAEEYPDVKFIAIDVVPSDLGGTVPSNVYLIAFKEEQAGYLAGYAAVKDGFKSLGFLGGQAVPAVVRFGYGFVQGADAAAEELQTDISIKYTYGGQFYGDANITAKMEGWYTTGTEVVFACGGSIYTSAVEAATKSNAYVIGVDVDQNYIGVQGVEDEQYTYNPFVTSAMKSLQISVETALRTIYDGKWSEISGKAVQLGLQDGDYVGLPTAEGSWNFKTFTVEEYNGIVEKIKSGDIQIDDSSDVKVKPEVSEFTTVEYID